MSRLLQLHPAVAAFVCLVAAAPLARSQAAPAPAASRVIGTVASVSGSSVSVKQDSGPTVTVAIPDAARVVSVPPGQKTLTGATKIAVSDIAPGDRVLMVVTGDPPSASIVVVNKQADIAAKQQQEQADWARRGVGGLVKSVDPSAGTVTITATNRTLVIHTTPSTIVRRYTADSVRFSDAQPSTLAAIQPGDQITARGDRTGDDLTAEEIVSGSFRNIAGQIVATDNSAGTLTVKDLVTKKTLTIKTTPDSDLRKLDPQIAQTIAARLRAAGSGNGSGNGTGSGSGDAGPGSAAPSGAALPSGAGAASGAGGQSRGAGGQGGGAGAGQSGFGGSGTGQGGGQGGGNALARVLQRSPEIHVADLHKGDAVMIVATSGSSDSATAIRLLAGVEPMLQASASGSQSMFSSAWSGLGGGASGDLGGGEAAP